MDGNSDGTAARPPGRLPPSTARKTPGSAFNGRSAQLPPLRRASASTGRRPVLVSADGTRERSAQPRRMAGGKANSGTDADADVGQKKGRAAFYSDLIAADSLTPAAEMQTVKEDSFLGPTEFDQAFSAQTTAGVHCVPADKFKGPYDLLNAMRKGGPTAKKDDLTPFPERSRQPKVQIAYDTRRGIMPRYVQMERNRRLFRDYNIEQLLAERNVDIDDLKAAENCHAPRGLLNAKSKYEDNTGCWAFAPYLPLPIFDNTDFECRSVDDWMEQGVLEEKCSDGSVKRVQHPLPAKAFLPVVQHPKAPILSATSRIRPKKGRFDRPVLKGKSESSEDTAAQHAWVPVAVFKHLERYGCFLVCRVDNAGIPLADCSLKARKNGIDKDDLHYRVPRVLLMFDAEDPVNFANRVADAERRRRYCEAIIRYNLYLDCFPTEGLLPIPSSSLNRLVHYVSDTVNLKQTPKAEEYLTRLCRQISLEYQRAMAKLQFDIEVKRSPDQYPYVTLPKPEPERVPNTGKVPIPAFDFATALQVLKFKTLLISTSAQNVLFSLSSECFAAAACNLFQTGLNKTMKLFDFDQMQSQSCVQVKTYLSETFFINLRNAIRHSLRDVGKGWFNPKEKDVDVYLGSKLKKLMEVVKYAMQDSIRSLVERSLKDFVGMITDNCRDIVSVASSFEWIGPVNVSPFESSCTPLFGLEMTISKSGIGFSTPLNSIVPCLLAIFKKAFECTKKVGNLEPLILEYLFWKGGVAPLETVGEDEPPVVALREHLVHCIEQALVPLHALARRFEEHMMLFNTEVQPYLEGFKATERTPEQIRVEISKHIAARKELEDTLPMQLHIGPFALGCEAIRNILIKRRSDLAHGLLDFLVAKLREQSDEVCNEFQKLSFKLFTKPNSIEELMEQKEFMKTIPDAVAAQMDDVNRLNQDYDVFDEFLYNLNDDDFISRWTLVGWPAKLERQVEQVTVSQAHDEEHFKKNLLTDRTDYVDKVDALELAVAGFSGYTDLGRAKETAVEARRVAGLLKDYQQQSQIINQRERLFELPVSSNEKLMKLVRMFEPYKNLWITAADWLVWNDAWNNEPLTNIDPESMESNVSSSFRTMHKCSKLFKDKPGCQGVADEIKRQIEEFKPYVPLIQALRNPGMRTRHWDQLSADLGFQVRPKPSFTFQKCLEMKMDEHIDVISKVAEVAGKEFSIEQALDNMEDQWKAIVLEIIAYKETGTSIMRASEECSQLLDDHIVMTQSMAFSPYKKPFEQRINAWENKLKVTQDVMDEWVACQRSWLYLEPIFSSDDIMRQLPVEGKRYQTMDRMWRKVMSRAKEEPRVIVLCPDNTLLESLRECNRLLDQVQKGLSEYLETKRSAFPRFYFLSDDELLEILSQTKDPTAVQPHLRKCFENIAKLTFLEDLKITEMFSSDGEKVPFSEELYPTGNVEDWLLEVERVMRASLNDILRRALEAYPVTPRTEWVLQWPGQIAIAGCQTFWTSDVTAAIEADELAASKMNLDNQLADLVALVRGNLTRMQRSIMSALIVIEVHSRDVCAKMVGEDVKNVNDFEWISQLRYYWVENNLFTRAVNAEFEYGYEYLGNSGRLVITPLTDRCYLTLTGALHLKFGGAPAGPAGTGKTETTKDLAKAMAIQCVVFNCSDQLDFMAMGKFFKGLASAGAWACFDEFNRIDIEVLSVVAQQITTIQLAQQQRLDRFLFEGVDIGLKASCAVFITMNPGYAGRTELPDNLKALFRPVAMMVPDYAMIAEIMLFSFGFSDARVMSKKITTTFKLSSEQLSSQDHYDFGMRAVKTVISAAGNLKRANQDMDEELIVLRAIRDVNVPKFLQDDLKLFNGIVSDLFPQIKEQPIDYGDLEASIRTCTINSGLKDVDNFITKCIQLYETTVVRHGLMLVGPTGSGKTQCYRVLKKALSALKGQVAPTGYEFTETHTFVVNPKSITMGQLYGEFDLLTHEWTDGILSSLIRWGASAQDEDKKWYMFDGPVDAVWIENMNTVLDDNKKLCLSSGEIIKLSEVMTMMFEVQDLAVASPATVSRCGMVYLEPSILGLQPFVECWLKRLPKALTGYADQLSKLFDTYMEPCVDFLRENAKEYVPSVDSNLCGSMMRILDCFFAPFAPPKKQLGGSAKTVEVTSEKQSLIAKLIEPWFFFALVWGIGGSCDEDGRCKLDKCLREKMKENNVALPFPEEGLVYDYQIDDLGVSKVAGDDDDDDDAKKKKKKKVSWVGWMEGLPDVVVDPKRYSDIIVPTMDTVRSAALMELLLTHDKQVLCVGPTGTSKTLTVASKLLSHMPKEFLSEFISFSARTGANQTQDMIDSKLDKRRKGIFAPPLGKFCIFFIDDLNMPALETYGAQPPIELLRQWMDHGGWYDRKQIGAFRNLVDIGFICAMGPPGGGRNPVTPRFLRHFNFLTFCEMETSSKHRIFKTILDSWLVELPDCAALSDILVTTTIDIYGTITSQLLPTPAKSHYTFNLRDLSKVFQGLLMAKPSKVKDDVGLYRLWFHECCRVFEDRLVNNEDRNWFEDLLRNKMATDLNVSVDDVLPHGLPIYGDFAQGSDVKTYEEITDIGKMVRVIEENLEDYNQTSTAPMNLVLFLDAARHVARISRIIRQPLGNALLLGVGGSGRQSLTRLASHMADFECFQIELSKNYGITEWKEDLKNIMLKAGLEDISMVFLFSDTQIKEESFLEDINNILNSGDVPNIYALDELDKIYASMKGIVQDMGLAPTKANLFSAYTKRVRSNIHSVITMSPIGETFRERLRMFPSLVNCCTIDWFSAWPDEALQSVARSFMSEMTELDVEADVITGLVDICVAIHMSVADVSKKFLSELSRHNYVTPTSYLELLGIFSKLLKVKKTEVLNQRNRTKIGLDKLLSTAKEVAKLQEDLEEMQPMLKKAQVETEETIVQINRDTLVANETRARVKQEEEQALQKAMETEAIKNSAQKDLDEALPALDAALASLKLLNKGHVTEVRSLTRPPQGVRMVIEACCIMKEVKPKKVAGDKPGVKIDDYWEVGKAMIQDPNKFLESLFNYDKENIPSQVIEKIQPYIDNQDFMPEAIKKVSLACTSICQWVRAMHKYHFVAKGVEPKRQALKAAQKELEETQRTLAAAKKELDGVEQGIAVLQARFQECEAKKVELANNVDTCSARLGRAEKLIGGLADEKDRWADSVENLNAMLINIVGDVLVAAGAVAYLGPFTGEYRAAMVTDWMSKLAVKSLPHTPGSNLLSILGDPVAIRSWQIAGLPRDNLSVENGIVTQFSNRWPLFIDPQGQANRWVKNKEKERGLDVVKLTDRDFLRSLENAVRFGRACLLENVGEELDPALEPILLRQTYKQAGSIVIKLGDAVIPYHNDFCFYITTKLPNPHYTPEVSTKVTLVNFTLSPSGLEDQLLALVVAEERPDLEEAKNHLIVNNAKMKQELKEIEDKILEKLSSSEGSPVDDVDLIDTLERSKVKSEEIKTKVASAEATEKEIDDTRSQYIPVARRTQILFFCVTDLSNVDPMYQYSLEWFIGIFKNGIAKAEPSEDVVERIGHINEFFTFSLYSNVCRSLFEKHKLLFSFLLCARILMDDNRINMDEWRYLLAGGTTSPEKIPNPASEWLSERAWFEFLNLTVLPTFAAFATDFPNHTGAFRAVFDSPDPHREPLPGKWNEDLDTFQKMLVLRCLRVDKITNAMQDFVAHHLGQRFIEPQTADLSAVFGDSSPTIPLIFVLSTGTDPAASLYKFADEMNFTRKLNAISLGQGQGPRAEELMQQAMDRGKWVFFQNCHLSPSWMPALERLIENIDKEKVHKDFRLWLTSMPSPKFPVPILQNSSKMTIEPPKGIKANLLRSYTGFSVEFLETCSKAEQFKGLLLSLCLFHGITLERRKFGALGFNIPYEFTEGDLAICISQLKMFLNEYSDIPYKVLTYTAGHINYGGRVTDDWDRRCLMNILHDFYDPTVLKDDHAFSPSGIYHQFPGNTEHQVYVEYIKNLPINDTPEIFGLHENANITFAQNETFSLLDGLLTMQPKTGSGKGRSREEVVSETANSILERVSDPLNLSAVMKRYPVLYEESMNTVLIQEVIRYNRLLTTVKRTLRDMLKALKGLVVMSAELEKMFNSLYNNAVPDLWAGKAYPSLKPLASWVTDLVTRLDFIQGWVDTGIPTVFWISGFFFPQAFLTGTLQNFARREVVSIDTISFDFEVMKQQAKDLKERPASGCYIHGLFLEGARWNAENHELGESRPKELYTDMPIMWLKPAENRVAPTSGFYECPVYKTLQRAGTLSTTGHSTNYVVAVEVPSSKPQNYWIKQGVALLCALNY
ncbi:dynein axonemal heavy chain 1-like [Sycon ciliatum]|uniref:dynein axonemal heavy chain 1-like n=1 Tax=Sycon ciliatum TaxID=27933 RepID=UPI0031F6B42B